MFDEENEMAVSNKITEKDKALEAALSQIQKQFGKGSIMKLGDDSQMNIEAISTGSINPPQVSALSPGLISTCFEYKQLVAMENVDALVREEIICATCVLHPRNFNFKTMANDEAGYPGTLAQIIMESSGFTKEYGIEVL